MNKEAVVTAVIELLKGIKVDGETMQQIIKEVGMEEQMHRQLILTMPSEETYYWYSLGKQLSSAF